MNKTVFFRACLLLCLVANVHFSYAYYTFKEGEFYYYVYDEYNLQVSIGAGEEQYSGNLIIPTSVVHNDITYEVSAIGESAFKDCLDLESVTLHSGIKRIGDAAFQNTRIKNIVLPEGLIQINRYAFSYCKYLSSIVLPKSLKEIGSYVFLDCIRLQTVDTGDGLEELGVGAFAECTALHTVHLGSNIKKLLGSTFKDCSELHNINLNDQIEIMHDSDFKNCIKLKKVVIGANNTVLGDCVFAGCSSLEEVEIHVGAAMIGRNAFEGCVSLKEIVIPNSVENIAIQSFSNCTSLERVIIGDDQIGDTKLSTYVFAGCKSLKYVFIGSNVSEVGSSDFMECDSIESIVVIRKDPPKISEYEVWTFTDYAYENATLYVLPESIEKYKAHHTWGRFFHIKPYRGEEFYLTIKYADNGCVKLTPTKGESYELTIEPEKGWRINTVLYNGEDVTSQLSAENVFRTPAITKDSKLIVTFESTESDVRSVIHSNVKVYAERGCIVVKGVNAGELVSIYTLDGIQKTQVYSTGDSMSIPMTETGIYLVKTPEKTVKLAL